ncbi:MAG: hypothetical protein ACRCU3_11000 [Eubacteriaceae bacterium]
MIHFQSDESGACLRGSEVKPKLDRFIHDWIEKKNNNSKPEIKIPEGWYINKTLNKALNYKIRLETTNGSNIAVSEEGHKLFLGNIGVRDPSLKKKRIKYSEPIKGKITSFITDEIVVDERKYSIVEFIREVILIFFTVNNFGMRQTKGYGSFRVVLKEPMKNLDIRLEDIYPNFYYIEYKEKEKEYDKDVLEDIFVISGFMKSGFNVSGGYIKGYALKYFYTKEESKKLRNDKAFIKQFVLVGNENKHIRCETKKECTGKEDKEPKESYRFVRGMLGLPDSYSYNDSKRRGKVSVKNTNVKRFASPIVFKKHGNKLYIFPNEIPDQMYGKLFSFNGIQIQTPTKKEFNLVEFLDSFAEMFNRIDVKFKRPEIQNVLNKNLKIHKYMEEKNERSY